MTRIARSRSRTLAVTAVGSVTTSPIVNVYNYGPFNRSVETCSDSYGTPWVDSSFLHKRSRMPSVTISGSWTQGGLTRTVQNSPMWGSVGPYMSEPWILDSSLLGAYTDNQLALMAQANMNPNNPSVDLPVSIFELHELPGLIRDAGRLAMKLPMADFIRQGAKANLMAQFGLLPILSDLEKLLNFVAEVDKREAYLRRLNTTKPARIKRKLGKQKWSLFQTLVPWQATADTSLTTNRCVLQVDVTRSYWFTARARLSVLLSQRDLRDEAFWQGLGLRHPDIAQIWELLPWSWLIDWFTTTGSILAAYRGGIPFVYEGLCVMRKTDYATGVTFPNGHRAGLTCSMARPQGTAVTHSRTVNPSGWVLPVFVIPYLDWSQISILASLVTLRVRN